MEARAIIKEKGQTTIFFWTKKAKTERKMDQPKSEVLDAIFNTAIKILPPFIVGLMAKVANDIRDGRKLSILGWMAIASMTLSGTFFSNWLCELYNLSKSKTLVINAFSTLFSEQIFKLIFANFLIFAQEWLKENLKMAVRIMGTDKSGGSSSGGDTKSNP